MKNIVLTSAVALIATATTAFAGGIAPVVMEPAPAAPVAVATPVIVTNDWSGFYLGGQIGTGKVELEDATTIEEDLTSYGVQAGYLYDLGSFVLGAEASYNVLDIDNVGDDNSVVRAGVIAGYDAGRFLPYLTGGYASLDVDNGTGSVSDDGYFYGVGATYAVTDSINVGVEYVDHQFDEFDGSTTDINAKTTSLKVNYAF